jgi:glucose/arabinose dehydrogenase
MSSWASADTTSIHNEHHYQTQVVMPNVPAGWSLDIDDLGRYWVTLRSGKLLIVTPNNDRQIVNLSLPQLYTKGQGGLLDLVITAQSEDRIELLLSYAQGTEQANRLAVQSVTLVFDEPGWQVVRSATIFKVETDKDTPVHFAGRMLLLPDQTFLLSSGDGFDYREQAQVITSQLGKTLRMDLAGRPVKDPPFLDAPYVFTLGHRNQQGLALGPKGNIWQHEHGPAGGDEINLLQPGLNYGWPAVTRGKDYSGAVISVLTEYPNMEKPMVNWTPSIAPSSMVYYRGKLFPHWQDHLLIATLKTRQIHVINPLDNFKESVVKLDRDQRLRDIAMDNAGNILLLTDGEDGQVLKLSPLPSE